MEYNKKTGLPINKEYLESCLPFFLQTSLSNMKNSLKIISSGSKDYHFDISWCELNSDVNFAEVDNLISTEQAWYLREKYLNMKREECI